ncbi:MAG: hypothetical protein ACRDH7_09260 [Actinomycetota bacterium]
MKLPDASRQAMLETLVGALDGGYLELRSGLGPADPDDAANGMLLATITLNDPAFVMAGSTASADTGGLSTLGLADGTPQWFRAYTVADVAVLDGTEAEIELNTVSISEGLTVQVDSWTVVMQDGT